MKTFDGNITHSIGILVFVESRAAKKGAVKQAAVTPAPIAAAVSEAAAAAAPVNDDDEDVDIFGLGNCKRFIITHINTHFYHTIRHLIYFTHTIRLIFLAYHFGHITHMHTRTPYKNYPSKIRSKFRLNLVFPDFY